MNSESQLGPLTHTNLETRCSVRGVNVHEVHESKTTSSRRRPAIRKWLASNDFVRYEEEVLFKSGVGTSHPDVQSRNIRMRIIMAAANCSPAVASCRAKFDGDFRVPTPLGAQELTEFHGSWCISRNCGRSGAVR